MDAAADPDVGIMLGADGGTSPAVGACAAAGKADDGVGDCGRAAATGAELCRVGAKANNPFASCS